VNYVSLKIRDFIYLDTERLKSIIAQIEQGLVNISTQLKSNNKEVMAKAGGSLLGLLEAAGGAKYVWQNQATETRTLHDNIYNKVENALTSNDLLITIPGNIKMESIDSNFESMVSNTSFILAKGKVIINDFTRMRLMLEKFNDLGKFIAQCSVSSLPSNTSKHLKNQALTKTRDKMTLDKSMIEGFKLFFDLFYKDRVVIKMLTFENYPDFRLVGNLKADFLRENISSIIYKYGTAPVSEWTIFAQVASIPPKDMSKIENKIGGADIGVALQQMFNAFREVELLAQSSVVHPEIAITPIAIYRE